MEKEFKENLSSYFNDGIDMHGEVEMINLDTGEVLFRKHNMIVQGGRNFIRDLFLTRLLDLPARDDTNTNQNTHGKQIFQSHIYVLENDYLSKIKFGSSSKGTTLDMKDLGEVISGLTFNIVDDKIEEKLNVVGGSGGSSNEVIESYQIKVKININNDLADSYTLGELGLFYTHEGSDVMFSRVSFDPIIVGAGSSLQLTYYIYF